MKCSRAPFHGSEKETCQSPEIRCDAGSAPGVRWVTHVSVWSGGDVVCAGVCDAAMLTDAYDGCNYFGSWSRAAMMVLSSLRETRNAGQVVMHNEYEPWSIWNCTVDQNCILAKGTCGASCGPLSGFRFSHAIEAHMDMGHGRGTTVFTLISKAAVINGWSCVCIQLVNIERLLE